jgi:Dolichyl-phosphate-mannose-protein mannosyltransferase
MIRCVRRHAALVAVAGIVLASAAVRFRVAGVPLERDEGEYAYAGQLILQGIPPYQLAYNMKFPGTYYAYSLILTLFGHTPWGIHVGLLAVNAATIVVLFLLGRRLLGEFGGLIAATAFAVLSIDRWVFGVFAHATHFVMLPALVGWLILGRALETKRASAFLLAGLLLGTAVLMKQHAVAFVLLGAGLVVWHAFNTRGEALSGAFVRAAWLGLGAAIPFALLCLVLGRYGVFGRFWFWTVLYAKEYVSEVPSSVMLRAFWRGFGLVTEATFPIWWLVPIGIVGLFVAPPSPNARRVIGALSTASILAMIPGFYFRQHYFILVLPAAALLVAVAILSVQRVLERRVSSAVARGVAVAVFLIAVGTYVVIEREYLFVTGARALNRQIYPTNPFVEAEIIGRYIQERTGPDDRIAVLGSEPEIYFYAKRKSATGHIYTYALMEQQPYARQMQAEMIKEIEAAHPVYLVFVRSRLSWLARSPEEPILQWADRYIRRCYERVGVAEVVERADDTVMRWDADARDYQPASVNTIFTYRRKNADSCTVAQ